MVILNRIYTRTGDDGTTALGSGERRPKYDLRVSAYGTVDETNAVIGVARLHLAQAPAIDAMLGRVQNDLFDLGADSLSIFQITGRARREGLKLAARDFFRNRTIAGVAASLPAEIVPEPAAAPAFWKRPWRSTRDTAKPSEADSVSLREQG